MKTVFKKSFAGDLKKLTNENIYYRIRTGNFRIGIKIVSVESETAVVFVRALHRKDIYRKFP